MCVVVSCSLSVFDLQNMIHTSLSIQHQESVSALCQHEFFFFFFCGMHVEFVVVFGEIFVYILLLWSTLESLSWNGNRFF